jgi:hypothetical protein
VQINRPLTVCNTSRLDREDNCYADLQLGIAVTVRFYAARVPCFDPRAGEPVAVIRQRDRRDHDYLDIGHFADIGQQLNWQLSWNHTPMLADYRRGNCEWDLAEICRAEAEQIAADLAARYWPPEAARLPWVISAYPG